MEYLWVWPLAKPRAAAHIIGLPAWGVVMSFDIEFLTLILYHAGCFCPQYMWKVIITVYSSMVFEPKTFLNWCFLAGRAIEEKYCKARKEGGRRYPSKHLKFVWIHLWAIDIAEQCRTNPWPSVYRTDPDAWMSMTDWGRWMLCR